MELVIELSQNFTEIFLKLPRCSEKLHCKRIGNEPFHEMLQFSQNFS